MQHTDPSEPPTDRQGMEVLDDDACWRRLAEQAVGRLAITVAGAPHLVPVNHVVRNREILFVSVEGTKLHTALHEPGAAVAFEVDDYDPETHRGWSVVVNGHIHPVQDLVEHTSLDLRGRPIWLDGYHDRSWLRIVPEHVNGRGLRPAGDADRP